MGGAERRRAERHAVDFPAEVLLAGDRRVRVRVVNIGALGALCEASDLEEAVIEGERAVLDHPVVVDGRPSRKRARTVGSVVRVDLEFTEGSVCRHLAIYFDGGPPPEGVAPA
jgi:hypothetical protein